MATPKKTPAAKKTTAKHPGSISNASGKGAKAAAPKEAVEKKVVSANGEMPVFGMDGKQVASVALPAELFGASWNADLVHQVVTGMQANARTVIADTKGRGEVRGGGKKPWKQKGTGRARHGSSRSPIWKGGGVTHGPTAERVFAVKINKKMRRAAFLSVLSQKAKDGELILVDQLSFAAPKTKDAKAMLDAVAKAAGLPMLVAKKKNAAMVAFAEPTEALKKSFRNIGNVEVEEVRNLNPVDLMTHRYLILANPVKAFAALSGRTK